MLAYYLLLYYIVMVFMTKLKEKTQINKKPYFKLNNKNNNIVNINKKIKNLNNNNSDQKYNNKFKNKNKKNFISTTSQLNLIKYFHKYLRKYYKNLLLKKKNYKKNTILEIFSYKLFFFNNKVNIKLLFFFFKRSKKKFNIKKKSINKFKYFRRWLKLYKNFFFYNFSKNNKIILSKINILNKYNFKKKLYKKIIIYKNKFFYNNLNFYILKQNNTFINKYLNILNLYKKIFFINKKKIVIPYLINYFLINVNIQKKIHLITYENNIFFKKKYYNYITLFKKYFYNNFKFSLLKSYINNYNIFQKKYYNYLYSLTNFKKNYLQFFLKNNIIKNQKIKIINNKLNNFYFFYNTIKNKKYNYLKLLNFRQKNYFKKKNYLKNNKNYLLLKTYFLKLFLIKFLKLNFNLLINLVLKNILNLYKYRYIILLKNNYYSNNLSYYQFKIKYFNEYIWLFRISLDLDDFNCFLNLLVKELTYLDSMKQKNFLDFFNKLINHYQKVKFYFFNSFRLTISGKLFNNPRKSKYNITSGLLSLTPLNRNIRYLSKHCHTKFGTLGIKLWWSLYL